jgi:hypothetical protein
MRMDFFGILERKKMSFFVLEKDLRDDWDYDPFLSLILFFYWNLSSTKAVNFSILLKRLIN